MRRADGKIDENDAVAVRFNDPSEIGKGKKYRGGIIVRVNADRWQRGKRGICGEDNGAALIVENPKRGNTALRELQVCIEPEAKLSFEELSAAESHLRSTRRSSGTVTR